MFFSQRKKFLASILYKELSNCQGICLGFSPYIDGSGKVNISQILGYSVNDGDISGINFGRQRYMVSINLRKAQTNLNVPNTTPLLFSVVEVDGHYRHQHEKP